MLALLMGHSERVSVSVSRFLLLCVGHDTRWEFPRVGVEEREGLQRAHFHQNRYFHQAGPKECRVQCLELCLERASSSILTFSWSGGSSPPSLLIRTSWPWWSKQHSVPFVCHISKPYTLTYCTLLLACNCCS